MHWATTKNNAPRAPSADKEIIAPNPGDEYDKQRRRRWNQWIYDALSMLLAAIREAIGFIIVLCSCLTSKIIDGSACDNDENLPSYLTGDKTPGIILPGLD
mmetsp:Transcript_12682/g.16228  ORF Transcript_12682/g.16228 Transcript_12682/m.16228 type:complete len:101 (+) Transcript_12682:165-467(+)